MNFPSSNLCGTVISVHSINKKSILSESGRYKSLVILKNVVDKGWSRHSTGIVRTAVSVGRLNVAIGRRVGCVAFEDMGDTEFEGKWYHSWEMTKNFHKVNVRKSLNRRTDS